MQQSPQRYFKIRLAFIQIFLGLFLFVGFFSSKALAVPPPDFLFNVGSQLAQIFAVIAVFLSAVFGAVWQFIKIYFAKTKHRKLLFLSIFLLILVVSFALAWLYQQK